MKPKPYFYQVFCNSLFILESLDGESKTGYWLYEDILPLTYVDDRFQIQYFEFYNKKEFFQRLEEIRKNVVETGKLPILHIEAHGDDSGFEISRSKEEVTWTELNNKLAEINFATRNNLVLTLGICQGHYINIDLANRFKNRLRSAYAVNISPERKIDWNEIKYGYSNFYQNLLRKKDFGSAMEEMFQITHLNILSSADSIAHEITDYVKKFVLERQKVSEQLEDLIKKGKELLPGQNYNRNLKALRRYKRELIKKDLMDHWNHFLMIDCFEENFTKFPSFEIIWDHL